MALGVQRTLQGVIIVMLHTIETGAEAVTLIFPILLRRSKKKPDCFSSQVGFLRIIVAPLTGSVD